MIRVYVGTTARGGPLRPEERRRHAYTSAPASRTGRNKLALCGASILPDRLRHRRPPYGLVEFDPAHPLACPRCTTRYPRLSQYLAELTEGKRS